MYLLSCRTSLQIRRQRWQGEALECAGCDRHPLDAFEDCVSVSMVWNAAVPQHGEACVHDFSGSREVEPDLQDLEAVA